MAYVDADDGYRRQIGAQLNIQEARHQLARRIFHGQRGELRQRYREGREDELGALGRVLNAVVLWNTRYMDLALRQVRARGVEVKDADVARLSPLVFRHINFLVRHAFTLPEPGRLRPLRGPAKRRRGRRGRRLTEASAGDRWGIDYHRHAAGSSRWRDASRAHLPLRR